MLGKTWKSPKKMERTLPWDVDSIQVEYSLVTVSYEDENQGKNPAPTDPVSNPPISLNAYVGKKIQLTFTGQIRCVDCGRPTSKSFNQGSCFPCFTKKASNDLCILQPTRCHYHLGTCREPEWGEKNCFQSHSLYLAISSGPKVGITKEKKIENRWIDQGASLAIEVLKTDSRIEAGFLEEWMGKFIPDKTAWQKMVSGEPDLGLFDLTREREKFFKAISKANLEFPESGTKKKSIGIYPSQSKKPTQIIYPIQSYPKAKSIKMEPGKKISSELLGIKGQYLLLGDGVINLRNLEGHRIEYILG
jgi:hypothetical protein